MEARTGMVNKTPTTRYCTGEIDLLIEMKRGEEAEKIIEWLKANCYLAHDGSWVFPKEAVDLLEGGTPWKK